MLFTITGKHIEITDAIRQHTEEKVFKLPKYYNSINQVDVIISSAGGNITAEIIARAEHSKVFIVTETGDDAYKCIDFAVRKVERQIRKTKEKERNHKHSVNPDNQ